jgi:hypothetical protein
MLYSVLMFWNMVVGALTKTTTKTTTTKTTTQQQQQYQSLRRRGTAQPLAAGRP